MTFFVVTSKKRYTIWRFVFDLFMTGITGGLWLVWLFYKHLHG